MASQIVHRDLDVLEIVSFIRGYHAYMEICRSGDERKCCSGTRTSQFGVEYVSLSSK